MKLHTGKTINDGLARAYSLLIREVRTQGLKGALAMNEAAERARNPRHQIPKRELDLLKRYDILNAYGSMDIEMRKFILACTEKKGSDFRFVDPQTGR